jgi:signal transduction histidine kinase
MKQPEEEKPEKGKLHFKHLPGFAKFLLEEKLDELAKESLAISREADYPLLKYFAHIPEESILELSKTASKDFYTHAVNNTLEEHLHHALDQWKQNQLPLISKDQVVAQDITLAGYVRRKVWTKFLKQYTADAELILQILAELDEYQQEADSASFQIFIDSQMEKIEQINKQLLQNENLYKQAQELTRIGNWIWSLKDGKIHKIQWSDELYMIYGLEPQSEEITLDRFVSFSHPDDKQKRIDQIQLSLESLDPPPYTMRIIRADGKVAVLSGKNEVLVGENGKPYKIFGTCQDITAEYDLGQALELKNKELIEANRSLENKNKELERSNKELTSFSYIASHDLQEPLRKIKTYSNLILETESGNLSEKAKQHFGTIVKSASRMQQLIQDLLAYSQTLTSSIEMKDVDLNATIREVMSHYDDQLRAQQLIFKVGDLPTIKGIPFQFTQLFQNIISNSVKYRRETVIPEITITSELIDRGSVPSSDSNKGKKYYRINISDNGIGFDPQYGEKIFEIFQRLHSRDEYSGTGVGLAICKKIVQNHDGYIYATGTPGAGAVFSVLLPQ